MGSDKKEKRRSREREGGKARCLVTEGEGEERGENEEEEECGVEMFSKCKELVVTMLLLSLPLCFALASSEDEGDVFYLSYSMISAGPRLCFQTGSPALFHCSFHTAVKVFDVDD